MDILIVEDEIETITDLKDILMELGHKVVGITSNGKEAIKMSELLNPDLILINIKLKGEMGGVEAAKAIINLYKIPIIFITVFTKNCLIKSLQLTEDAITISKPIKQDHLEYCISRAFSQ